MIRRISTWDNYQKQVVIFQCQKLQLIVIQKSLQESNLCGGAVTINIDEIMAWEKPTDEQIKNLHDLFCIDVEILDSGA